MAELSERGKRTQAALKAVRDKTKVAGVRVVPLNDKMRKVLKHPSGIAFGETGSVEWPLDAFTQKRLQTGSVRLESAAVEAPVEKKKKVESTPV